MIATPADAFDADRLRAWFTRQAPTTSPQRPLLVSVSGGLDSMVLWHLVRAARLPHEVLHVNFGLRGMDSDADAALVLYTAQLHAVQVHSERADFETGASGIQAHARALRLAHTMRLLHRCSAVALAHHADDQAETVLMKLSRGTGPKGLAGMQPVHGQFLRPLLEVPKARLAAFAKTHEVSFREDGSNASDAYARNRFRHHVLPTLSEVEPRAMAGIGLSAKRQAALLTFAETQAEQVLAKAQLPHGHAASDVHGDLKLAGAVASTGIYDRNVLAAVRGLSFVLQIWLAPQGFRSALVDEVYAWIMDGRATPAQMLQLCANDGLRGIRFKGEPPASMTIAVAPTTVQWSGYHLRPPPRRRHLDTPPFSPIRVALGLPRQLRTLVAARLRFGHCAES